VKQLTRLAVPFPDSMVQRKPGGAGGDYVTHSTVNQRLLEIVGPYSFEVFELIRGDFKDMTSVVSGALCRLTVTIDGREVSVVEVGDCENPGNWKTDGQRAKDAASDAFKRCAMRLGLGLHLWVGDRNYFLDRHLKDAEGGSEGQTEPSDPPKDKS
jgi:hypothetical protein